MRSIAATDDRRGQHREVLQFILARIDIAGVVRGHSVGIQVDPNVAIAAAFPPGTFGLAVLTHQPEQRVFDLGTDTLSIHLAYDAPLSKMRSACW